MNGNNNLPTSYGWNVAQEDCGVDGLGKKSMINPPNIIDGGEPASAIM